MKIRTDVADLKHSGFTGTRPVNQNPVYKSPASSYNTIDPQLVQSITSRLSSERNLSQALSIAQASQSLLQKAMIISSQLRTIAAQAVVQGKVNSADLEIVLSDINSTFGTYNKGLTGPVQAFVQGNSQVAALPGVDDAIGEVVSLGNELSRGEVPAVQKIDRVEQGIAGRMEIYSQSVDDYSRILRDNTRMPDQTVPAGSSVSGAIAARPDTALIAQGNLNPEGVYRILT